MRAGLLSKRVTIQQFSESQNDYGEPVKSWTTYVTRWAKITDVSGREEFSNFQTVSSVLTLFRVRYKSGITTKMRISHNSNYYNILSVKEIGRQEGIDLLAEAVAT
jgi:SPP1 family predicted phage head-tail adaptor